MAGNTLLLSIQQVMAGIGAKMGPGLRGRMGRLEACEEGIIRLWVDVSRRRKNNPLSVWLLGDDKATPEEAPPAGGAGCGGGDPSGLEPQVCDSPEATKGSAQGSSGKNQAGGKHEDSCPHDKQVSSDGWRPPKLGTIGCEEEEF